MFPLNLKFLLISCFEKIGGTERRDKQTELTDGLGATNNAASHNECQTCQLLIRYVLYFLSRLQIIAIKTET